MRPPIGIPEFNPYIFGIEMFFAVLIALSCFLIYFYTRDLYKLSEHKGIKYFRKGFLFISFAHILMILTIIFRSEIFSFEIITARFFFELFGLFFFIGIGFLFSSMYSKQIKEYFIYLISFLIFFSGFFFQTRAFMLMYSSILIIALGIASFLKLKGNKKKTLSQIYIIYILIFLSWIISLLTRVFTDLPFRGNTINIVISGFVFIYILYLVIKNLKKK